MKNNNQSSPNKWEEEKRFMQIINKMSNYAFPISDEGETSGKSILGAYANVAQNNLSKTLQYIYLKIGYNMNNTRYIDELKRIWEANNKEKEWNENNPGVKRSGPRSWRLLSSEQGEKLKTLLFHHFSVIAPILASKKDSEISAIKITKEKLQNISEEKTSDIIKNVKSTIKSANFLDCIEVLVCLSESLDKCRNLHSHYRAYNNPENQKRMFDTFAKTSGYLTNAFKASFLKCQLNAGVNKAEYDFLAGDYHYSEEKKERPNYYYRIHGKRNIIKANDENALNENKEPIEKEAISDFGFVYLVSLFLSKSDTETMLDQLEILTNSPFKDNFKQEKDALTSCMSVYRTNIPKGKRLKMEDDKTQLSLDMLNELHKCPMSLYNVLNQDGKNHFRREQTEPKIDATTGEYVREKFVRNKNGEKGQHKERTTDGTGNIVYQGKGTYSLLVRKEDRFPYFALRYIDNCNLFSTIRFQIDLGYYRFAFYPKERIDGSEETRILQKRINGFGKLVETNNCREEKWKDIFQESEIKNPNETETAEIAKDEEGNIIEIEQLVKADSNTKPFVTNKRANYNIHNNRIGLYWKEKKDETAIYIPDLKTKKNKEDKIRSDVNIISPIASLSIYDLPALIFHEYLREGEGMSAEDIIKDKYKQYKNFFKGIANGDIKSWSDVKELKRKDIPKKFWAYLDGNNAGDQGERIIANYMGKDVEDGSNSYHYKGHIQECIDYLEKEIKNFNDICIKIATTDNEYGAGDYKAALALLPEKMAKSIMEWLPEKCPAKKIMTGVNYGVMKSVLSQFGNDGKDIGSLKEMFIKGGIIANEKNTADQTEDKSNFHPFLSEILNASINNMESLFFEYITHELKYVKNLYSEMEKLPSVAEKRIFIQSNFPFAKLTRKRFDDRDSTYYIELAKRYLKIDNSMNGGEKNSPAIILLPDGLFTSSIFSILKKKHPDIFTGEAEEGANNNASYLISTYFEKVNKDESQIFYQCSTDEYYNANEEYARHYKFFDYYDNPELREENYPDKSNNHKGKSLLVNETYYSPKEINEKLKAIKKEYIKETVRKYIRLEEAKLESYKARKAEKESKLEETQKGPEHWSVYSKTKNRTFSFNKKSEIKKIREQLAKLGLMIRNSEQKKKRIESTYEEMLTTLKNECQRTEKTIRRYRIEDIVTFYMISTYFNEIFKDKPEKATFQLQDVGIDNTEDNETFLDTIVPFSRIIPVTFAHNESDMCRRGWEENEEIEKSTIDCNIFLERIAIRNYNLALSELKDQRLYTFLSHYAYIAFKGNCIKKGEPLPINYNRLMLEFKRYNQLRSDIFREVHAIEKIIVDYNKTVLNNERNRDFYIPMIKGGIKIMTADNREDKDAKRNSFVNLLALVFDETNELSQNTHRIRNSAAHNHYDLQFKELADEQLLFRIMRAYGEPDGQPHASILKKDEAHSFADLILQKIKGIRKKAEKEIIKLAKKESKLRGC